MTIRETVFSLLTTDNELAAEGITIDSVWTLEAVTTPERNKPFLVTAWSTDSPVFGRPGNRDLLVWAHDEGGDYSRIDRILDRVRELLTDIVHQGGITQVDWQGASIDLYDDGFRTITRNTGFRVIGADRKE